MKTIDNYSVDIFDRRGGGFITSIDLTSPQYKLLMWLEENDLLGDTKLIVFHSVDKCHEEDEITKRSRPCKSCYNRF